MDLDTIRRAQQGDEFAINDIYEAMYKRVYYLTLKIMGNAEDAEDATQDTFISAFKALPGLENIESFQSWLFQIAANRSRDLLRKNKRHETVDVSDDTEDNDTFIEKQPEKDEALIPEDALDNEAKRKIILQIISSLPDNQKECVMLFYYSEMSVKDIAEHLGVSEGTVKSRLNYARQKIKEGILETEEKQDIRLYGFIPLGLFLLKDFEAITAALPIPALAGGAAATAGAGAAGSTAAASGTAAGSSASAGAVGGGSAAASSAAGAAKAGLFAAAKTKVIAGVLAGVLAIGGIGAAVASQGNNDAGSHGTGIHSSIDLGGEAVEFSDPAMEHNMRVLLGKKDNQKITDEELEYVLVTAFTEDGMNIIYTLENDEYEWMDGTQYDWSHENLGAIPTYPGTVPVSSFDDLRYIGQFADGEGNPTLIANSRSNIDIDYIFSMWPQTCIYIIDENAMILLGETGSWPDDYWQSELTGHNTENYINGRPAHRYQDVNGNWQIQWLDE